MTPIHRAISSFAVVAALSLATIADAAETCGEPDVSWVKPYPKWIRDRQEDTVKRLGPRKYKEAMCAVKGMKGNPDADSKVGPQVWIEENWDVKPEKWRAFRAAYEKEIYSLARKTPGYRGFTFLTTIVPGDDEPKEQKNGGAWGSDPKAIARFTLGDGLSGSGYLKPHKMIQLHGVQTDRSIVWDALFFRTFNVQIVHHLQTWADADQFQSRMARLYAETHPQEELAEHLAKTVYPLSTNHWSATFRMIQGSWDWDRPVQSGSDADGLNLEPYQGPTVLVAEHFDVKPDRFCQFLADYERNVERFDRRDIGERGIAYATSLPPQSCEAQAEAISAEGLRRLGGDDSLYVPEPGILMDGVVRTNYSINVGALYKKTFNVLVYRRYASFEALAVQSQFEEGSRPVFAKENGMSDLKFDDTWATKFMHNINNHWDSWYRIVKTSFVPMPSSISRREVPVGK